MKTVERKIPLSGAQHWPPSESHHAPQYPSGGSGHPLGTLGLVASQIASSLKNLRKTPWLLQIPARKESCGTKWAELGCEVNLTTSLSHRHLWPSLELVLVILTPGSHHTKEISEQVLPPSAHSVFTDWIYYFLIVCQESIFCLALCLYLFPSCCNRIISSAYAFSSLWDYIKRYKRT